MLMLVLLSEERQFDLTHFAHFTHIDIIRSIPSGEFRQVLVKFADRVVRCCLLQVEELYDAYCIQRRLRDGASKMVAAFNSTTGSREARESLSEANKGYRECTEVRPSWRTIHGPARSTACTIFNRSLDFFLPKIQQ